jgi:hypothetical protein
MRVGYRMPRAIKTREERVKEGLKIITKLLDLGRSAGGNMKENSGFQEISNAVRTWIEDGRALHLKGVNFYPYDREGELILPQISGVEPTMVLKLVKN